MIPFENLKMIDPKSGSFSHMQGIPLSKANNICMQLDPGTIIMPIPPMEWQIDLRDSEHPILLSLEVTSYFIYIYIYFSGCSYDVKPLYRPTVNTIITKQKKKTTLWSQLEAERLLRIKGINLVKPSDLRICNLKFGKNLKVIQVKPLSGIYP